MPALPKTLIRALLPTLLLALTAAVPTTAQETPRETPATLEARATVLHDHPTSWERAAGLYREAARIRPAHDPRAIHDLRMAGKLTYYAGARLQAVRDLERAAEAALASGETLSSAMDLLDAAIVAIESGRNGKALELAARSRALAESPSLDAGERSRILRRVGATETVAMR